VPETIPHATAAGYAAALHLLGYESGYPFRLRPDAREADAELCWSAKCPACGMNGLSPHPYHSGRSYRLIAECLECGAAEEF
jgi:hypothetical protein